MFHLNEILNTKHDDLKVFLDLYIISCYHFSKKSRSKILELIITKYPESWHFQNVVCIVCACNITQDLKNSVQLSTIIVLFNKNEIWTRFLITPVILTAQKKTNNILWLMFQEFNIFNEVNWLSVVTNEFKYLRQLSSRLATVMFRGTPCISSKIESKIKSDLRLGRSKTRQTWDQAVMTIGKLWDYCFKRNLHVKEGWRMHAIYFFKDQKLT